MTPWQPLKLDANAARSQLRELRDYLSRNLQLSEGAIRDFIRARQQVIAAIGLLNAASDAIDRWAPELNLMAKHACDFVVGDSRRCAYTLVELEDATPRSIYDSTPATPYFSARFNYGYSQIVDWLCLLDGTQNTPEFRDYWGHATPPQFLGVLVIGRGPLLSSEAKRRMEWRSVKVRVNSHPLLCMTYDDLVDRLLDKIDIRAGVASDEWD